MAIQLYAAPIFIEAFQTGKAAICVEYGIRVLSKLVLNPDNSLVKGLEVLIDSLSAHRISSDCFYGRRLNTAELQLPNAK
ncbi:hypothetical protein M0D69_37070 [Caballeronia sp. SEWSISQ10-4 2]|uniref:hypothetical protein n=1 Tax=Caballeronia sp. SEWSISQ10-4 2 TaxID=2937438 RepID=UPI00265327C0|nr:hypothetical protein [Caballeronia sp. SEWSISQ10-4 2]MDN7183528.1 hypothetical protein [Caballeronia sp. SEWSISQ10-4 2]